MSCKKENLVSNLFLAVASLSAPSSKCCGPTFAFHPFNALQTAKFLCKQQSFDDLQQQSFNVKYVQSILCGPSREETIVI